MRTIYENYRGFRISKHMNNYNAIINKPEENENEVVFDHSRLMEILNTIDKYIEQ